MSSTLNGRTLGVTGAGIIGLTTAIEAAKQGATVTLYEQNRRGAMLGARFRAASPAAFAQVVPGSMAPGRGREIAESAFSRWMTLATEAKLSPSAFYPCGWYACATSAAEESALDWYYRATGRGWGVKALTRRLIGSDRNCVPIRGTACQYALFDAKSASVNPPEALAELIAYATSLGVKVHWDARVTGIDGRKGTAVIEGVEQDIEADGWVVASGNYDSLFPGLYRKRGFQTRQLQMYVTRPIPGKRSLNACFSGRTTTVRYGFTQGAPAIGDIMAALPEAVLALDANVLFAPHPVTGGMILSWGDTHWDENGAQDGRYSAFEVFRSESARFLASKYVPKASDIAYGYFGSYAYLADQGPYAEEPVLFSPKGQPVVLAVPTKGRGWTVAPELAFMITDAVQRLL